MLNLRRVVAKDEVGPARPPAVLTLTFEQRRKSRLLVLLDDGREGALLLPRGTVLRDGDVLRADGDAGELVMVRAAAETLSVARTKDAVHLARAAYHLGNRHIPLEVGAGWVAYEHDHVLDAMVRELGLDVDTRVAPFEPEAGGYRHGADAAGAAGDAAGGRVHGHHHHARSHDH
jgi:urease accessory protein